MRLRVRRLLGVSAFLFGLSLAGCSGQQQEEEGLEVSGQENQENGEGQEAEGNTEEGNAEGNEENSNEELNNENSENGEDSADAGDATENDLQEIIQEMNGQQTADTGDSGDATALEQDTAMAGNTGAAGNAMATPANTAPVDAGATAAASNPPPFQPGGSPAAPGLPEVGSKMAYIVEAGDTLGKISQKIYGSPGRWNELATLSGIANPSRIYPGDLVYYTLDESAVSFATAYESVQRTTENVQQGDTLATIATRLYGSSKAWRSIWRHNDKIDNPDVLTVSTVYYVPKGASTAAVNKIKGNIATVSKETLKASKKVAKSLTKKAKSVKVSMVSFDLNSSIASVSNAFGNGFCAAI